MAGLFAKAKAAAAVPTSTKSKKETVWHVGNPETDALAKSVVKLVELDSQVSALNTQMNVHKGILKDHATDQFVGTYVNLGVHPETPMSLMTATGEKVTFVVQDRSSQYGVKDDQVAGLTTLLGEDAVNEILYEETSFGFNRAVLAHPGVMEIVEKALESAMRKLTDDSNGKAILPQEVAEQLLDVKTKRAFRPDTLDRLTQICGRDTTKVAQFVELMGSSCTRYIKT